MMNKIGNYGAGSIYQNLNMQNNKNVKNNGADKTGTASAVKKTGNKGVTGNGQLSDKARAYLEELKRKYGDMDFIVADFETDEEADRFLARGKKEYNVLIDPDTLEEMVNDPDKRAEFEDVLGRAPEQLEGMLEELGEDRDLVKRVGISVDDKGVISYFAELDKASAKQAERLEKAKEEKQAEKSDKKNDVSGNKPSQGNSKKEDTVMIKADSIEELIKRIKNASESFKWQQEVTQKQPGSSFDFSV